MFLPSWQAIVAVYDAIAEDASVFERCIIYVLHSSLPMSEQTAVFEPAPPGVKLGVGWFCGYPLPRIVSCSMWCTLIRGPASHMPRMVRLDPGVQNVWTESRVTQLMQHIDGLACCTSLLHELPAQKYLLPANLCNGVFCVLQRCARSSCPPTLQVRVELPHQRVYCCRKCSAGSATSSGLPFICCELLSSLWLPVVLHRRVAAAAPASGHTALSV